MSRFYIENGEILDCGFFLGSKEQYVDIMNKQDQRIAELEQDLEFTTKTANELIEIKHKLEQELAEYKKYKEWQEQLDCKNADELIDFVMSNYLTEDEKCKTIKELNKQLAELKEKAIDRPKFKHLEEYWYIENNPYCDNELQVFNGKVMEIICAYDEDCLYEYRFDTSCRYIEEYDIFDTEQEAQAKLKEMKRNG